MLYHQEGPLWWTLIQETIVVAVCAVQVKNYRITNRKPIFTKADHYIKLIEAGWRIYVSNQNITASDNGLLPGWRQAISWTNAVILLIRTLGANFSELLSEIHTFSFEKMYLKKSSGTNAVILLIRTLGANFSEFFSEIHTFSFKKMYLKKSSGKWRPFCFGLSVIMHVELLQFWWWLCMVKFECTVYSLHSFWYIYIYIYMYMYQNHLPFVCMYHIQVYEFIKWN